MENDGREMEGVLAAVGGNWSGIWWRWKWIAAVEME